MCAREEEKEKGRWSGGEQVNDCSDHCETQIISLPLQLQQCQSSIGGHHSTQGIQLHGHGVALHCQLKLALLKQHVALFGRKITLISSSTQYCTVPSLSPTRPPVFSSPPPKLHLPPPPHFLKSFELHTRLLHMPSPIYITKTDCVTR